MEKEYLRDTISAIVERKREAGTLPDYAVLEEVLHDVREDALRTLRKMYHAREVSVNRTLNSVAFRVGEP